MNTVMHIQLDYQEGAVLRSLGLIERRGFRLLDMQLGDQAPRRQLSVRVDGGGRNPQVLRRQLLRLESVQAVMLETLYPAVDFDGSESPHQCVRALGEFGVRHRPNVVFDPAVFKEPRHVR